MKTNKKNNLAIWLGVTLLGFLSFTICLSEKQYMGCCISFVICMTGAFTSDAIILKLKGKL